MTDREHGGPEVSALREAASSLCADPECDLSGGFAHAGPCEPCDCPARHAVEECGVFLRAKPPLTPDEGAAVIMGLVLMAEAIQARYARRRHFLVRVDDIAIKPQQAFVRVRAASQACEVSFVARVPLYEHGPRDPEDVVDDLRELACSYFGKPAYPHARSISGRLIRVTIDEDV